MIMPTIRYDGGFMNKSTNLDRAKNNCANWNAGLCLGAMVLIKYKKGMNPLIHQYLDPELAGKPCIVNKGCHYFDNIVAPAIS